MIHITRTLPLSDRPVAPLTEIQIVEQALLEVHEDLLQRQANTEEVIIELFELMLMGGAGN
ncbi:hypothetical protein [Bacillus sp. Marseille-P3800]|uniref:hypothetical protein n=1 Tax=Bacillus sp. Marseille-P3800 TaxID=2014782 RepID=UPI000C06D19C|nr:hypothetical protein [Bacillus sp. Marseille-P3800]